MKSVAAETPDKMKCPITFQRMRSPVVCADGHTFERAAIERWLSSHDTSPLTGEKLTNRNLTPNVMARGMCRRWQESHRHAEA